jgi:hypothetical protein
MYIFRKLIRKLNMERSVTVRRIADCTDHLRNISHPYLFETIISLATQEFQKQKELSSKRLREKFHWILQKYHSPSYPDSSNSRDQPTHLPPPHLVTDKTPDGLNPDELQLLAKGPRFALSQRLHSQHQLSYSVAFQRLIYQLRWTSSNSRSTPLFPTPPGSSLFHAPPTSNERLELAIRQAAHNYYKILSKHSKLHYKPNVTSHESAIISSLKSKEIVCLPSDKGGEFCVVSRCDYDQAVSSHLSNSSVYRRLATYNVKKTEKSINQCWATICSQAALPRWIYKRVEARFSVIPRFYGLVKTHKPGPETKIRPIVNGINGPCYKLSWVVYEIIKRLGSDLLFSISSSNQLIQKLHSLPREQLQEYKYPVSLDISDMYTAIPRKETIDIVVSRLQESHSIPSGLSPSNIGKALHTIMENTFFSTRGKIYKQIKGLPMGSRLSGLLAGIFVDQVERSIVPYLELTSYCRYVDDIFLLTKTEEMAHNICNTFNTSQQHLSFQLETPEDGTLKLLDLSVNVMNGEANIGFFRKAAKSDIFLNAKTSMPSQKVSQIISNERKRILQRCDDAQSREKEDSRFREQLKNNGFTDSSLQKIWRKPTNTITGTPIPNTVFHLATPFISERMDREIKKALAPLGVHIRMAHRNYTLRGELNKINVPLQPCTLNHCRVEDKRLCYRRNIVYQLKCNQCTAFYIGSTSRFLHIRIREHMTRHCSSVFHHNLSCGTNGWNTSILCQAKDPVDLALKEGIFIRMKDPPLNSKEEILTMRLVL